MLLHLLFLLVCWTQRPWSTSERETIPEHGLMPVFTHDMTAGKEEDPPLLFKTDQDPFELVVPALEQLKLELELTQDQLAEIDSMNRRFVEESEIWFSDASLTLEERSSRIRLLLRELSKQASDVLVPHQRAVLIQNRNWADLVARLPSDLWPPAAAFDQAEVVKFLGLTKTQREQIKEILKRLAADVSRQREDQQQQIEKLRRETQRELELLLDAEQRGEYQYRLGDPFSFDGPEFEEALRHIKCFPAGDIADFSMSVMNVPYLALAWPARYLDVDHNQIVTLGLLRIQSIQEELSLTPRQRVELEPLLGTPSQTVAELAIELGKWDSDPQAAPRWRSKHSSDDETRDDPQVEIKKGDVSSILLRHQRTRLDQIHLQWLLKVGNSRPPLIHRDWLRLLNFTDQQRNQWQIQVSEFLKETQALNQRGQEQTAVIQNKTYHDLLAVLTSDQREKFFWVFGPFVPQPNVQQDMPDKGRTNSH